MVTIAGSEGAFNEMERNRIQGVMDFEQLKVKDIHTTPRINVTAFLQIFRMKKLICMSQPIYVTLFMVTTSIRL